MKCNLTSLIDALKLEFPLETCGDMALQISDLQGLTPDNPPTRPDVLYTIEQNQLLRYQGAPAKWTSTRTMAALWTPSTPWAFRTASTAIRPH